MHSWLVLLLVLATHIVGLSCPFFSRSAPLLRHSFVDGAFLDFPEQLIEVVDKLLFFTNAPIVHNPLFGDALKALEDLRAKEGLSFEEVGIRTISNALF